ncbi:hypothetical protein L1D14_04435 [Vibrio tubiashii]|uniref:hypothetical protein n=1 Tax=Vibrio tubiashii TaxID=29498 RepID=UPI001EFE60A1|nr:hypothetical protein [Vibrio tubiashii]MCG9575480.1 hypothetical protein [Vibrio tubiashii]
MCINCIDGICQGQCKRVEIEELRSPIYQGEATDSQCDLLQGNEQEPLIIGGKEYQAPITGWTHPLLHRYCLAYEREYGSQCAYDVYLGSQWVGGSDH